MDPMYFATRIIAVAAIGAVVYWGLLWIVRWRAREIAKEAKSATGSYFRALEVAQRLQAERYPQKEKTTPDSGGKDGSEWELKKESSSN